MSILIVEDNAISAEIIVANLRKRKYETLVASNGQQALAQLRSTAGIQLVISDIMMPKMDGLELLRQLKASPKWKDIPVIICSALADVENVKKASLLGCRYYLVKPIQPAQLLQKVTEALKNEKLVLKDQLETMSQYGIDNDTYKSIAWEFYSLLKEQVALLEGKARQPAVPQSPFGQQSPLSWNAVSEGASALGAERLAFVLASRSPDGEPMAPREILLAECKLLIQALKQLLGHSDSHAQGL